MFTKETYMKQKLARYKKDQKIILLEKIECPVCLEPVKSYVL